MLTDTKYPQESEQKVYKVQNNHYLGFVNLFVINFPHHSLNSTPFLKSQRGRGYCQTAIIHCALVLQGCILTGQISVSAFSPRRAGLIVIIVTMTASQLFIILIVCLLLLL